MPQKTGSPRILGLAAGQKPARVLVAEDQSDNQQVIGQLLKHIGCEVCMAADGREAVELFQSWRPQMVLMDIRMPEMDGYQATRGIRALPGGGELPIVALTASVFDEDREQVLAAGCNDMLTKPVEAEALFELIGRMLGLKFEYASENAGAPETEQTVAVSTLAGLPPELRKELAEMAVNLDVESCQAVVERLRADHIAEAELITLLLVDYRSESLIALCESKLVLPPAW